MSDSSAPASGRSGLSEALCPGLYRIDPVHTFAQFRVRHLLVGLVDGRFDKIEGEFLVTGDGEQLFDRIEVQVDASTVDTGVEARDEDLRSARFFDTGNFPVITYRGTDSAHRSEALWEVAGELTIRDVSRRVPLEVTVRGTTLDGHGRKRMGLSATTKLSRSDFNLTTELLQESGEAGALDIDVRVDVEAVLQVQTQAQAAAQEGTRIA